MGEEVDRIRAKLEKLDDALLEGRISEETYRELKEKYERRLRELQGEIRAGESQEPARAEPSEAAGLPPGVQESLSPAALAFVFDDELFGLTGLQENLFKFNRANVQVALMAAATLLSLEADGHVEIRPGVRGRILKSKTVMAVKRETSIPTERVMAKPLMGPVPSIPSTKAAMSVVTFESTIAAHALLKPSSMAVLRGLPPLNSSFNLSKMRTFASTAIPSDRMSPAIPGSVRAAWMRTSTASTMSG